MIVLSPYLSTLCVHVYTWTSLHVRMYNVRVYMFKGSFLTAWLCSTCTNMHNPIFYTPIPSPLDSQPCTWRHRRTMCASVEHCWRLELTPTSVEGHSCWALYTLLLTGTTTCTCTYMYAHTQQALQCTCTCNVCMSAYCTCTCTCIYVYMYTCTYMYISQGTVHMYIHVYITGYGSTLYIGIA